MSEEKIAQPHEPKKANRKKREKEDLGLWFQQYLGGSRTAEEALFKINELLYAGQFENTRRNARAPLSIPVSFQYKGASHSASSYTLSQKGAFIKCPQPPEEGADLKLTLQIPDGGGQIEVEGQVINSISLDHAVEKGALSGMTVVFKRIRPEDRRRIDKLVKSHNKRTRSQSK